MNLSGLIYAPFGHVKIQAQNLGLNNIIVIAETVTIISSSVNVNYSSQMAEFVGTESELLDIPDDERKYLEEESFQMLLLKKIVQKKQQRTTVPKKIQQKIVVRKRQQRIGMRNRKDMRN